MAVAIDRRMTAISRRGRLCWLDLDLWTGIRKLAQPVFGDKIFKHEGSERPLWVRGIRNNIGKGITGSLGRGGASLTPYALRVQSGEGLQGGL